MCVRKLKSSENFLPQTSHLYGRSPCLAHGVHQLVPLQLALVQELLPAAVGLADVLLLPVRDHVLLVGALVGEDLVAVVELALECFRGGRLLFRGRDGALALLLLLGDL